MQKINPKKIAASIIGSAAALAGLSLIKTKLIYHFSKKYISDLYPENTFMWHDYKINYTVKGTGEPLLLVHGVGIGASHKEWDKNIDSLAQKYKVYALDLLGFGFSDKPKITYTAYTEAVIVNNFITEVIKEPVYAIGSSHGCDFVMLAAHEKPENFKKLIFITPAGILANTATNTASSLRATLEAPITGDANYEAASSKSACKKFLAQVCFFAKEKVDIDKLAEEHCGFAHYGGIGNKYVYSSFTAKFFNFDIRPAIRQSKLPMLVVWGENTKINAAKNIEIFENLKPDAEFVLFEQTRLLPHYENYKEFNKIALEFLAK